LSVGFQARAHGRGLTSAAFLGSSFGVALGAIFLLAGLAPAAHSHFQAVRLAKDIERGDAESMLHRSINGKDGGLPLLARAHDPAVATPAADVPAAWPGRFGARLPLGRRASMIEAERDLDCLTQAIYYEARSESERGQAAVAQVVMNRLGNPNFPKTVCGVVFQGARHPGCQFSFACDGSMRQAIEGAAWDRARSVAEQTLAGVRVAAIGAATHYHTVDVDPYWGASMLRVAQVGLHIFYRPNPHWVAPSEDDQSERAVLTKASSPAAGNIKLVSAAVARSLDVGAPPAHAAVAAPAKSAETAAVPAADSSRISEPTAP
jgi:hypothetical protein